MFDREYVNCLVLPFVRYSLHHVCDSEYGGRTNGGRWTGLIGELVDGRADIALANMGVSAARNQFLDFPSVAMSYAGAGQWT